MPGPVSVRELRYLSGTTFNKVFVAADNAAWAAGTATKLRATAYDASGLVHAGEADATLQTRKFARPANIPTLRNGSLKFSTYLGAATSDLTANPVATLISKIMGGIALPLSTRTETLDSVGIHTATRLYSTGIEANCVIGQAVLVGTRGDARGNGEVRVIADVQTNYADLAMALDAAPLDDDEVVISTTVYLDQDSTQEYLDFLGIGLDADDQIQTVGGMGPVTFSGLGNGELPTAEYDIMVGDWREVSVGGNPDQLEPTAAPQGNAPPVDRGLGCFTIGDTGVTTLNRMYVSDFSINPGLVYEALPDMCGVNGVGGWVKMASAPTASFNVVLDGADVDILPGLHNDWTAGTAKQILAQFGHAAQKCVAFDMQNFYLDQSPARASIGALAGLSVSGHGSEGTTTTDIMASSMRIHWF